MAIKRKYFAFVILVLASACANEGGPAPKNDSDYFPMEVGAYHTYDVEETRYEALGGQEDLQYQLKLSVVGSFENSEGGITYAVQRFTDNKGNGFEYLDTWSVRIGPSRVVVSEGGIDFVKLAFPLSKGRQWNGNALNTLGGDEGCGDNATFSCDTYEVTDTGFPFSLNGDVLNETLEVVQSNNPDLIVKQDVRKKIYARHIGLVYKEATVLEYCTVGDCIGKQQIEKGYTLKQTLTAYGKE